MGTPEVFRSLLGPLPKRETPQAGCASQCTLHTQLCPLKRSMTRHTEARNLRLRPGGEPPKHMLHDPILGLLIHGLWAGRESSIFGVCAAPATPKTIPEDWGRSPAPFGMVFGAAGAVQTPKISDFRPAQKPCIKNSSVCILHAHQCLLERSMSRHKEFARDLRLHRGAMPKAAKGRHGGGMARQHT